MLRDVVQDHLPADRGRAEQSSEPPEVGQPVLGGQSVSSVDLDGLVEAGQCGLGGGILRHVGRLTGVEAGEASNMAKYAAAEASLACLDQAIQVHGGNGLTSEYGLADLWFTARLMRTAPVSKEMVLNFVAQQSLGLPKSY